MVFTQKFEFWLKIFLLHFCETWFFNLLRPPSLPFFKIEENHSDSMFYYLKNYLFLKADFEFCFKFFFPSLLWNLIFQPSEAPLPTILQN